MKYPFALAGLLTFVVIPSSSFAGCSEHDYETEREDDSKCNWEFIGIVFY